MRRLFARFIIFSNYLWSALGLWEEIVKWARRQVNKDKEV